MKLKSLSIKRRILNKRSAMEDMQYLQKKINGKSVYSKMGSLYNRKPKHRSLGYLYQE